MKVDDHTFVCQYCHKVFDKKQRLAGHTLYCEKGPHREKNLKNLKNNRPLDVISCTCQYCGKDIKGKGNLVLHERACKENPTHNEYLESSYHLGNHGHTKGYPIWNKGKTKISDERIYKASLAFRKHREDGIIKPGFQGCKHSDETKEKLREKAIEYINKCKGPIQPRYSIEGCHFFDILNDKYGWNLQHAENGGEIIVNGYFLDAYDKKLNIVVEYDEEAHYDDLYENILSDKDIYRQNQIIKALNCTFFRYNRKLKYLYMVNCDEMVP